MASGKLQKPTNEEHKFSQKVSEVTAWGSRMFGHKQHEHQAMAKHCSTCQCPPPKETKPTSTAPPKKEHATTKTIKDMKSRVSTQINKKKNEEQASNVHKDAKHSSCIELRKKDKQHTTNVQTKDSKQPVGSEMKMKDKKEHRAKSNTSSDKEHKQEPASHYLSSMADRWKEKIVMMKKSKDGKSTDSSSDSDSEDKADGKIKINKRHSQGTKSSSK